MGLELRYGAQLVAEIFYFDANGEWVISFFKQNLPLPVIEQFIAEARAGLRSVAT